MKITTSDKPSNEALFADWLRDHRGIVVKVARSFTVDAADSDDLIQEILIRVWASIDNYRGESKTSTWIYRVALNRALTWKRDESTRRSRQDLSPEIADHAATGESDDGLKLDALYGHIRRLPEIERSLVLLSLDGFSYAEMADIVGMTESNVGARLSRARTKLFGFIERDQPEIEEHQHD